MNVCFAVKFLVCLCVVCGVVFCSEVSRNAVKLNSENFDQIIGSTELVFVNFYADWCRFSKMLEPLWDKTAALALDKLDRTRVTIAKIDSDRESAISSRYRVSKYPTLKLFRHGQPVKKEYRGQRSEQAFVKFLENELRDPVRVISTLGDIKEDDKGQVIGYFSSPQSPNYAAFQKMAAMLKDECSVLAGFGEAFSVMMPAGEDMVVVRPPGASSDVAATVPLNNAQQLAKWAQSECVALVGVITFDNAEELTEAGVPFLILFHHPDDKQTPNKFRNFVKNNLQDEKSGITFLTADGLKFAHPLHHLGKSKQDLPLIAIDSFRHMYVFPDIEHMETPGRLKSFIDQLHSGQLHREFHYGVSSDKARSRPDTTTPPDSVFRKLAPSDNRYTFKDEL